MAREVGHIYADIIKELKFISKHTKGLDLASYSKNDLVKHAVERALLTISEAVRGLPSEHLKTQPSIPWKEIKGIGNPLRHEYHRIADQIIWETVDVHIPPLTKAIKAMAKLKPASSPKGAAPTSARQERKK